jgi:hypothetical protein
MDSGQSMIWEAVSGRSARNASGTMALALRVTPLQETGGIGDG